MIVGPYIAPATMSMAIVRVHGRWTWPVLKWILLLTLLNGVSGRNQTQRNQNCESCIVITRQGAQISHTLIYHTFYSCIGIITSCTNNGATYSYCEKEKKCFNPKTTPRMEYTATLWRSPDNKQIVQNTTTLDMTKVVLLKFDMCKALQNCGSLEKERQYGSYHKVLCLSETRCWDEQSITSATWQNQSPSAKVTIHRKRGLPTCQSGSCNPMELRIKVDTETTFPHSYSIGMRILNPGLQTSGIVTMGNTFRIHITAQTLPETEVRYVFHSYYRKMKKEIPIPIVVKNMFVHLAEKVAQTLGVQNCYVCGGTNMGKQWPWEAKEINYSIANVTWTTRMEGKWVLSTNLVARLCWSREGETFTENVGHLRCESAYQYNETIRSTKWWSNGLRQQINLTGTKFEKWISQLGTQTTSPWEAPKNMYWLCGTFAYAKLPPKWKGSCALGYIKPSFFLLPIETGNRLGVPVYGDLNSRVKRALISTANIKIGDWKDDEWPPSRIIQYYGPATWAEDGMYGYRTPIYLLNRLIRLQAVIELLTNDTAIALNLMAKQNTQMRTAIYQNRLALDYLLAQEGGVCGKFNLTNCCIQIDDQGKAIEEITNRMVKLAHVSVQKWTGAFEEGGWFRSIFGD
ncbi:endogenous retrovirus group 3 member 1 Env polyprotein-like [Emydura macquarii macquarii]|uniref:endogenous retrovirus group 3 member 1 Env polyprotein-like n=1 Tax=Emydura macquarii macquarii TaxID=1129001 RepID=UPI00352A934E